MASQIRYLNTWLLALALLGVGFLLDCAARREASPQLPALLLAGSWRVFPYQTKQINNLVAPATQISQDQAVRAAYYTPETFPAALTETDRVYFVGDDTAVLEKLCAEYCLYPTVCDASLGHNFHLGAGYDTWADDVSPEAGRRAGRALHLCISVLHLGGVRGQIRCPVCGAFLHCGRRAVSGRRQRRRPACAHQLTGFRLFSAFFKGYFRLPSFFANFFAKPVDTSAFFLYNP